MLHAVMLEGRPLDTPVGEIATFPVLHVDEGDFLFNAMVMMTRQASSESWCAMAIKQ